MKLLLVGGEPEHARRKILPILAEYGFVDVKHVTYPKSSELPLADIIFVVIDMIGHAGTNFAEAAAKAQNIPLVRITRREPAIREACQKYAPAPSIASALKSAPRRIERPLWAASCIVRGPDVIAKCARGHETVQLVEIPLPPECATCAKDVPVTKDLPKRSDLDEAIALLHAAIAEACNVEHVTVNKDGTYKIRRVVVTEDEGRIASKAKS